MRTTMGLLLALVTLSGCGSGLSHGLGNLAAASSPVVLRHAKPAPAPQATPDPVGPFPVRFAEVVNTHHDLIFRGGVPNDDHLKLLLETGVASTQSPSVPVHM